MNPTTNPDFLQQIFGQTPSIPDVNTPVPFAEDDLINERQKQLEALDPSNRVASLDPFGRNRRTGTNNTRSKKDKLNTALSYITEFLGAATGGPKYQNPYQRARIEAMEDYKLQAPRLIDELKILNQNKRSYEVEQSKARLQESKNELAMRVAKLQAATSMDKANLARKSQEEKLNLQREYLKLEQEGSKLPVEYRMALAQVGTTLKEALSNPEVANNVVQQQQRNRGIDYSLKSAAQSVFGPQKQKITLGSSAQKPDPNTGETSIFNSQREILAPAPNTNSQNLLNQLFQGKTNYSLPSTAPTPQIQPVQPQEYRPLEKTPILSPKSSQNTTTPGNIAVNKTVTDTFTPVKSRWFDEEPDGIARWKPQDFGLESPQTARYLNAAVYDDVIGYKPTQDGRFISTTNNKIIEPKFYGPAASRRKQQETFQTFRDATYSLNSMAALAARQHAKYQGNLFTGVSGSTGRPAEDALEKSQSLRPGFLKQLNDKVTEMDFGRQPDAVDQYLSLLTTESYLRKIYESTGKQMSEQERQEIAKTWISLRNNPDAFLERLLQLTIKANRKLYAQYENFDKKNKVFNLGDLANDSDTYAVTQAKKVLQSIKNGKFHPRMLGVQ